MNGKRMREKLNSSGFTLIELLVVVGILAILTAIVLPGLAASYRDLKITELDDTARELFLSAQSELTDLKVTGRLQTFANEDLLKELSASDTEYEADNRYLTSGEAEDSLPQTALLLSTKGGSYVLKLNPLSGDVCAVFYAERTLNYGDVSELDLSQEARSTQGVGYYGGVSAGSARTAEFQEELPVSAGFSIVNGNDLYVKVACTNVADRSRLSVRLNVTGETDSAGNSRSWYCEADGYGYRDEYTGVTGTDGTIETAATLGSAELVYADYTADDGTCTLYFLLDSLVTGRGFSEICTGLTPGDDVTVSAQVQYRKQTPACVTDLNEASVTVNSLFSGKTAVDSRTELTAENTRQLSNLRHYAAARDETVCLTQMKTIDFTARSEKLMPGNEPTVGNADYELPAYFEPLSLSGAAGSAYEADGNGYLLRQFSIRHNASAGAQTGLFGSTAGALTLTDVLLEDPTVVGTDAVGTLIGSAESTAGEILVSGCGAYATAIGSGTVSGGVDSDTAQNVGGLIGAAENGGKGITVTDSFSALAVSNAGAVTGGLIGTLSGGTVQNCFTSGTVRSGASVSGYRDTAGGLVGAVETATNIVDNCYSTADVYARANGGGLAGTAPEALTLTDSYAYGTVTLEASTRYGPLVGDRADATYSGCGYLSDKAEGMAMLYSDLTARVTAANRAVESRYPWTSEGDFPFPTVTANRIHYGSWPTEPASKLSEIAYVAYYEQYTGGTYGYYTVTADGETVSTLTDQEITATGFAFLAKSQQDLGSVTVQDEMGMSAKGNSLVSGSALSAVDGGYSLFPLNGSGRKLCLRPQDSYTKPRAAVQLTLTWTGATRLFYLNTNFACLSNQSDFGMTESNPLVIRTRAQLENITALANLSASYQGFWFAQTHDIAAAITTGGIPAGAYHYDGGGCKISGLSKVLFIYNQDPMKNIHLTDVAIANGRAALVETANASVTDCSAEGSVTATSGSTAGLVYTAYSSCTLSECFFVGSVTATSGSAAGLIMNNMSATVKDCWTAGTVTAPGGTACGFQGGSWSGGVQTSYSLMKVSGRTAYGFASTVNNAGSFATCYWAKDTGWNEGLTSMGTAQTLAELMALPQYLSTEIWIPGSGVYPYPQLKNNLYTGA